MNWQDHSPMIDLHGKTAATNNCTDYGRMRTAAVRDAACPLYFEAAIASGYWPGASANGVGVCAPSLDVTVDGEAWDSGGAFAFSDTDADDTMMGILIDRANNVMKVRNRNGAWKQSEYTLPPSGPLHIYGIASGDNGAANPSFITLNTTGPFLHALPEGAEAVQVDPDPALEPQPVATLVLQSGYSASVDGNVVSIVKD